MTFLFRGMTTEFPRVSGIINNDMMLNESINSGTTASTGEKSDVVHKSCVIVKPELCKACGLCIEFCPRNVLQKGTAISGMGYEFTVYCGEGCSGCGTCFYVCPEPDAITVISRKPLNNSD
jgi:NAD-dependent dihydropyrimidine dehydrogenase PreA subunit